MPKTRFEWDPAKDSENQQKHGVAFIEAQYAFADPQRVMAADLNHSDGEDLTTALAEWVRVYLPSGLLIVKA